MAKSILEIILNLDSRQATSELKKFDKELNGVNNTSKKSASSFNKLDTTFNKDFLAGLTRGTATTKDFGAQLLQIGDQAGLSTTEMRKMAGATGFFTDQQLLAGKASADVAQKAKSVIDALGKGEITTREAGKEFEKFAKAQEVTATTSQKLTDNLFKFGAIAVGAAAGAVKVGQALYDLGRRGAVVDQTEQSFEGLLEQWEIAPDLLDDLRTQSRGTVDDMTLMQGTLTLVAGSSEKLGKEMLKNSPRLLEIAKAANKLNPALGDTNFLYESITTGIKRNSKMVLDNLGIVFSQTTAYEEYAATIGKTVDELDDEDKALATLNATMKAGNNLINQVGGNVDSATDSYAQMEVQVKNLTDQLSKEFTPVMAQVLDGVLPIVEGISDFAQAERILEDALESGYITKSEQIALHQQLMLGQLDVAEATDTVNQKQQEWLENLGVTSDTLPEVTQRVMDLNGSVDAQTAAFQLAWEAEEKLKGGYYEMAEATDDAGASAEELARKEEILRIEQEKLKKETEELNSALDDLNTFIAGRLGKEYEDFTDKQNDLNLKLIDAQNEVDRLSSKEIVTEEQQNELDTAKEKVNDLKEAIKENADEHDDATKRIMFNILQQRASIDGLTAVELQALNDIAYNWGIVDQATYDYTNNADLYFSILNDTTDRELGEVRTALEKTMGLTVDTSNTMDDLGRRIKEVEGDHEINIKVKVTGDPIPHIYQPGVPQRKQYGGSVYGNQVYLVGEKGPELFVPDVPGEIVPNSLIRPDSAYTLPLTGRGGNSQSLTLYGDMIFPNVTDRESFLEEISGLMP